MLKVEETRKDFPLLNSGVIYLDNASTSLTPEPVLNRMLEFYRECRANVGRGVHRLSREASEELSSAREKVRRFIAAGSGREVIFTRNTTEGINLVAEGLRWEKGDEVVTTLLEHHSNLLPWLRLRERGVRVRMVKPDGEGVLKPEGFEREMGERTKLVALTHVSNVLGTMTPVEEIVKLAHERGARVLVDAAQSAPHLPLNVKKLGCDYLAFSGHKMLGPTGIGVLYVREEHLDELEPLCLGGGTIEEVSSVGYRLTGSPERYEAGTPPIAEAVGLGEAVEYLSQVGRGNLARHEGSLVRRLQRGLEELPGVEVYGPSDPDRRVGIVPFNVKGMGPHEVATILDQSSNIMVRSGHHCAMPLHTEVLNRPEGTVRASVYLYNTEEEVESLVETVGRIIRELL
ncbi:MAG: cysteine desulfurase [Candidatus Hadarchaeales archaeon]